MSNSYAYIKTKNPVILTIKYKLIENGNITTKELIQYLRDNFKHNLTDKTLKLYIYYVKTNLLKKEIKYYEVDNG